jgi:myo-inositol-hexaphosphate 3-phosphohydrolase
MNYKMNTLLLILLSLAFYACNPAEDKYSSPKGYDLQHPEKFNMPESLLEISGLAFHQGQADTVYSVQDEDGRLFKQAWGIKKQSSVKFAKSGDYEDVAIAKQNVYVLKSSGSILSFPLAEAQQKNTALTKEWKDLVPKAEYEGLYADEPGGALYLLCKACEVDKKAPTVTGYLLNIQDNNQIVASGTFTIDLAPLKALGHEVKKGLKASALSKHPVTGDWYILSSANKLLLIAGKDWKIKEAYHLNSSLFNQPEGIAFDAANNLYISNEGDEITAGNILKFNYKMVN